MTRSRALAVSALFIAGCAEPGYAQTAVASPAPAPQTAPPVSFQARANLTSAAAGATVKDLKGPLKRYLVDYAVDPHPFAFTNTPDGVHHARVEFAAVAYSSDGKRLNYVDRIIGLNLAMPVFNQVMQTGVPMHQEIDLPAGSIHLRIVVHDLDSSRVGAMEIPLTVAKQ